MEEEVVNFEADSEVQISMRMVLFEGESVPGYYRQVRTRFQNTLA